MIAKLYLQISTINNLSVNSLEYDSSTDATIEWLYPLITYLNCISSDLNNVNIRQCTEN